MIWTMTTIAAVTAAIAHLLFPSIPYIIQFFMAMAVMFVISF